MTTAIETQRNADFKACPILSDYIATMLQDLQFREMDEACMAEREERDTGTIYTLSDALYAKCKADCESFMAANATAIEQALELVPGEEGLRYGRDYMTHDRIGYYFYMTRVGHGVGFTDDATPGESGCLATLEKAARDSAHFEPYIGDDGEVYA
jgi:hypothetical protein